MKKPAPKKLAKKKGLFAGMMARGGNQPKKAAAKKLPAPKKTVPKKKILEPDSEDELPAKKSEPGGRNVSSDSTDFEDVPTAPREKAGGTCFNLFPIAMFLIHLFFSLLGRSRAPVSYQGLDESD